MSVEELIKNLEGHTITKVTHDLQCDCGLVITLDNGSKLEYGYSGGEGITKFNQEKIWELY